MATKNAKYGKAYNTPIGLQEDIYYEMMYDLINYVEKKKTYHKASPTIIYRLFRYGVGYKTRYKI